MDLSRLQLKPHKLYHHLEEVLRWKKGEYFPPIFAEISVTDQCNHACHFCNTDYIRGQKVSIEGDLLVRIFRDLGEAGVKSLQIQGTGEPLMNRALADAIVAGHEAGLSIALCSNGVLMKEAFLEKVMPSLEWIRISAVEATPEVYAKSHGCPESHWQQVTDNLRAAVKIRNRDNLDVVLSAHTILFPYNVGHIYDTGRMLKDMGLDYYLVKSVNQSAYNESHPAYDRTTHLAYREALERTETLQDEHFLVSVRYDQFELQTTPGAFAKGYGACYGMMFETMVDADARVYPCLRHWRNPEYCLGDLREMSFDQLWRSERRQKVLADLYARFNLDNCQDCCKTHHVNKTLWELANPPMHKNFL